MRSLLCVFNEAGPYALNDGEKFAKAIVIFKTTSAFAFPKRLFNPLTFSTASIISFPIRPLHAICFTDIPVSARWECTIRSGRLYSKCWRRIFDYVTVGNSQPVEPDCASAFSVDRNVYYQLVCIFYDYFITIFWLLHILRFCEM